tara:strand:+ start:620 stop:1117 length:498 start_codon:yes stop_codon:yes gene_type:complete
MKNLLLLSALFIFACSPPSDWEGGWIGEGGVGDINLNTDIEDLGLYTGDIQVSLNENYESTVYNHSMRFNLHTYQRDFDSDIINIFITEGSFFNEPAGFYLNDGVYTRNRGNGNDLTIFEYGTLIFTEDTIEVVFHQDNVVYNEEQLIYEILSAKTWAGTLSLAN